MAVDGKPTPERVFANHVVKGTTAVVSDSIETGVQNLNVPSCRNMRSAAPVNSTGWSAEQSGREADAGYQVMRWS